MVTSDLSKARNKGYLITGIAVLFRFPELAVLIGLIAVQCERLIFPFSSLFYPFQHIPSVNLGDS